MVSRNALLRRGTKLRLNVLLGHRGAVGAALAPPQEEGRHEGEEGEGGRDDEDVVHGPTKESLAT